MTVKKTTLNTLQRMVEIPLNNRTVVQPTVWYTCPAGKRALITGQCKLDNYGAASAVYFQVNSAVIHEFNINDKTYNGSSYIQHQSYRTRSFQVELGAGDQLKTTQDIGTNAEFNVNAKILELPA